MAELKSHDIEREGMIQLRCKKCGSTHIDYEEGYLTIYRCRDCKHIGNRDEFL